MPRRSGIRYICYPIAILLAFALQNLPSPVIAETLTFSTTLFPPFSIHDDIGNDEQSRPNPGFIMEMVHEAFKRHDLDVKFRFLPAQRAIKLAESGLITGNFQSTKPQKASSLFYYSRPFSNLSASYFTLKDYKGPTLYNMEDGRKIRVATTLGTPLEQILNQLDVPHFIVKSEEFGLKLLMGKRVDAYLAYTLPTEWTYRNLEISDSLPRLKAQEVALYPYYLTIHKDTKNAEKLINQFDESISNMKRDGSYHDILIKYVNYLKP